MPMEIDEFYPGDQNAENLLKAAIWEQKKLAVQKHSFRDGCHTSLLWKTFHFAFVSPVIHVDVRQWFRLPLFLHEFELDEDVLDKPGWREYWRADDGRMVDFDLEDAAGTIYQLRMAWIPGGGAMDGFHGFYGKIWDRIDPEKTLIGEIFSEDNGDIRVEALRPLRRSFLRHGNLNHLIYLLKRDGHYESLRFCKLREERQWQESSFLLAVALFVARQQDVKLQPQWADSTNFVATMLRLLGKYKDGSDDDNAAALQVLCGRDGSCRDVIAAYAAEPYIAANKAHPVSHNGSSPQRLDNSMLWYTEWLRWLAHAFRCRQAGDNNGAFVAFKTFAEEGYRRDQQGGNKSLYSVQCVPHPSRFTSPDPNVPAMLLDRLDALLPLTLGLENDLAIFPVPLELQQREGGDSMTPLKRKAS